MGRSFRLIGWFLAAGAAAGCAGAGGGSGAAGGGGAAAAPTPEMIEQGRTVFAGSGNCRACHGMDARGGNFGPNLTDGQWIWFDANSPTLWDDVTALIRDGIPQPRQFAAPMPARGGANLTDEQVRAVAAYVISLN